MNFREISNFIKWEFQHILKQLFIDVNDWFKLTLLNNINEPFLISLPKQHSLTICLCNEFCFIIFRKLLLDFFFFFRVFLFFRRHLAGLIYKLFEVICSKDVCFLWFYNFNLLFANFSCYGFWQCFQFRWRSFKLLSS